MAERLQARPELGRGPPHPLATARTLPCSSVIRVTIRSASPSRMVRSTMPRSRNRVIGLAGSSVADGTGSTRRPFVAGDGTGAEPPPAGRLLGRPEPRPPPNRLLAPIRAMSTGG